MKQLDRLLFEQGNQCFFCRKPLKPIDASVEHLVASANGGSNGEENCVACCKKLNALLGSKSLKEKMQIVLNQRGSFRCPEDVERERAASVAKATSPVVTAATKPSPQPPAAARPKATPQPQSRAKQQPKTKPSPPLVALKQYPTFESQPLTRQSVVPPINGAPVRQFASLPQSTDPMRDVTCPTCKRTFSAATSGGGYKCRNCDTVFRY